MPVMTKMRDNMPVILIGLIVVFLFSIMFDWGMDYLGYKGSGKDVIGEIDGKEIRYQEFSEMVQKQIESQKQQSGTEPNENTIRQIREQVWNNFVTQFLLEKEAERLGISVTDQEVVDWVRGANPPEFLMQQFRDSLGKFNRTSYESALNDQRNKDIWVEVEKNLRQQRLFEKVQSIVLATVRVTPGEVLQRFGDQNISMNIEYALFDPNRFVKDADATISDEDLKKYFYDHQTEFKINATRKLKYILFGTQPTNKDSIQVMQELEAVKKQAEARIDFLELQKSYMEKPSGEVSAKHGEMMPEKEKAIFSAKVGQIVGPVKDFDGFHLIKILGENKSTDFFVKARHILFADNPDGQKQAKEILTRANKGENFSELAKKYSTEPGANQSGGDLGWFGKGRMVKEFESAAMNGKVGQIVGPIKTQFGYHIIKIEERDNRELKIVSIILPVKTSSQTIDEAYQRALDFSYLAKKGEFEEEAKSLGLTIQETGNFEEKGFVPGIGMMESINRFSFKNDVGDVSDAYNTQNGIIVFKISEAIEAGVRPFEQVKTEITPRVSFQKKLEKTKVITKNIREKLNQDTSLSKLLTFDGNIVVQTTGNFTSSGFIPNLGREASVAYVARTTELGKISNIVVGERGCYLVKVLSRTPFDSAAFKIQKDILSSSMLQEKKQRMVTDWIEALKKDADIEDNRDLFYR